MIKDGFDPDKLYTIHNSLAYDKQIEVRKQLQKTSVYQEHFGNDNKNLFLCGPTYLCENRSDIEGYGCVSR